MAKSLSHAGDYETVQGLQAQLVAFYLGTLTLDSTDRTPDFTHH
jgi:hypothetical protein